MLPASKTVHKPSLEDFVILKVVGRGVMGKVMLVKHKMTDKLYALKSIHKQWILSHGQIRFTQSERAILAAFRDCFNAFQDGENSELSKFLIRLHASFQTETEIFYVLDYHAGGDLASILGQESRLGEAKAKFFAAEIAVGLGLLHTHGIIYRDLKPENVLIDERGHIVLTDFGLSKILKPPGCDGNAKTSTFCGTAEYLAPELLKGEPYDQSVDWWSYGTMLYEMITGITPYWCEIPATMYRKILYDPILEFPSYVSPPARDLVIKLLNRTPCQRPTMVEVKRHAFFNGISWPEVEARQLPSPITASHPPDDTSAFDEEFTRMPAAITPADYEARLVLSKPESQELFSGFSYYPEMDTM